MAQVRQKDEDEARKKNLVTSMAKVAQADAPEPEEAPEPEPTAAPTDGEMSLGQMLAMAAISLGPALLGGALGGKQGAMAGAASGTGAAAGYAGGLAKKAEDDRKLKLAQQEQANERKADWEDFTKKEDYKDKKKGPDSAKAPTSRTRPDGVMEEWDPETKSWKTVASKPKGSPKDTSAPDPKELRGAAMQARNKFTQESRPYVTALNSAKDTEKLATMAKENPRAAGALMGKLARAAGEVGVLSDADIKRLGGSEAVQDRLERFMLLSTSDQKITDDDIRSAQELARSMQESAQSNLRSLTESQVNSFVSIYGGTREDAYKKITGMEAPSAEPPPPSEDAIRRAAMAEKERRLKEREQAGTKSRGATGGW